MHSVWRTSIRFTIVTTVLLGLGYPMLVTGIAGAMFPRKAAGSLILKDGQVIGSELLAQVIFTPLLAAWSIWVATAISTRCNDTRVAQQLSILASLPTVVLDALIAFGVIHASSGLAFGLGALLLVFDFQGWRIVAPMFDRERLIAGTKT